LAFLDISQIVDGHTLLIPKKHVRWVWNIENIGQFLAAAQKIVKHFQSVTGEEFVMSVTLGVMVKHAHLHLLPRTEGNAEKVWDAWVEAREARRLKPEKMKSLAKRFGLTDGDLELRS
jgi:diadenosine tetraphosphate (Ap4A) HIT family hydrolase